jgi:RNA polymerase primary sigma factor
MLPPLNRDDEYRLAVDLSDARREFTALVLNLPAALRDVIFDDEFPPPTVGRRWPIPRLEVCFERFSERTSEVDDRGTKQVAAHAKRLKERIDHARTRLVLSNFAFVVSRVGKLPWRPVPFVDLVQEGILGLIEAVDRFEPDRGHRLQTYAIWWIRCSVSDALRDTEKLIRIPEHAQLRLQALRRAQRELHELLGREPTRGELAEELDLPLDTITELSTLSREPIPLEHFGSASESPDRLEVLHDAESPDALRDAMDRNICERVHEALGMLASREARVIRLRFGFGGRRRRTLSEIGKLLSVSRERVRQIEQIALGRLRSHLEALGL